MSEKLTSQEDRVEQHVRTIEKLESEKADLTGSEFQTLKARWKRVSQLGFNYYLFSSLALTCRWFSN